MFQKHFVPHDYLYTKVHTSDHNFLLGVKLELAALQNSWICILNFKEKKLKVWLKKQNTRFQCFPKLYPSFSFYRFGRELGKVSLASELVLLWGKLEGRDSPVYVSQQPGSLTAVKTALREPESCLLMLLCVKGWCWISGSSTWSCAILTAVLPHLLAFLMFLAHFEYYEKQANMWCKRKLAVQGIPHPNSSKMAQENSYGGGGGRRPFLPNAVVPSSTAPQWLFRRQFSSSLMRLQAACIGSRFPTCWKS